MCCKVWKMWASGVYDSFKINGPQLWVTAQKQKFISASYFWVGSDVRISGEFIVRSVRYDYKACVKLFFSPWAIIRLYSIHLIVWSIACGPYVF